MAVLIALVVVVLGAPAAASAAAPVVDSSTYIRDVQAGAASLQRFGAILESTQDLPDLVAKSNRARVLLTQFDRRFYVMSRYRVVSPILNRQRARLARTSPPVTAILSRFLDAALMEDLDEVTRLAPIAIGRINAFQRAAGG
ncbi:hypothetical protein [Miltoncostaea oceani]|uniref:hypothetical protein n=1 Tax=Miltoncostaea oceani TaxID=2843216 RepID=UPI001C3D6B86|nr:hypothetical protein [Miltoncostaea oceani]